MKKKILIVSHGMELGGVERSLLGLLESFDYSIYDVDLFLLHHKGELMKHIPHQVNLLPENSKYSCLAIPIIDVIKKRQISIVLSRIYGKWKARQFLKDRNNTENDVGIVYSHKFTLWNMPKINPEKTYDLAISFLTPHFFVSEKVKAKRKIAWIHTDYTQMIVDVNSELKMWDKFDQIISISDDVTATFLSVFPTLKTKIVIIKNILPAKLIEDQANVSDPAVQNFVAMKGKKLLSIGRFCYQKNFESIPQIAAILKSHGLNLTWGIIGYGPDEQKIRNMIDKYQVNDEVIILGKIDNPYPYIKKCDVYIQPSRYEGHCVAVREAQLLNKPVIITDYSTSSSQVKDNVDGFIVPLDIKECAESILKILLDNILLETVISNIKIIDHSNREEVLKIYDCITE